MEAILSLTLTLALALALALALVPDLVLALALALAVALAVALAPALALALASGGVKIHFLPSQEPYLCSARSCPGPELRPCSGMGLRWDLQLD